MIDSPLAPIQVKNRPVQGQWTYEDYLRLPDDGRRYEIIEGVLYVANAPDFAHQHTVLQISRQMANFVVEHRLGHVLVAPFEVHLSETTRPVQPDIIFIKTENLPTTNIQFFEGVPDVVIEVLSPSSIRKDRSIKFTAYEQAGVSEYWIVNPHFHTVEVYTLSGGEYALLGEFMEDDVITSVVLEGLEIVNSTLYI